jgi:hypothetical protein
MVNWQRDWLYYGCLIVPDELALLFHAATLFGKVQ